MEQETMECDFLIVGAGPTGLAAAIRLAQLSKEQNKQHSIIVLEKASQVGAHILSGAIMEPSALNELLPDWQNRQPPPMTPAKSDSFVWLTKQFYFRLPTPTPMHNKGNYIISLGQLCAWLATQAENLGVNIFPGFPAAKMIVENEKVIGVETTPMGIDKNSEKTSRYQPGLRMLAKHTLIAEGCHGSLSKTLIKKYNLREDGHHQTYGLGVKELWEVNNKFHKPGKIIHTIGWPLDYMTYGGSFLYHLNDNKIAVGFVVGLDYKNPTLDPFHELQRFKTHRSIKKFFANGKRIGYGARAIIEGGIQSLPKLSFPGGMLIGDCAGFLNVPKIKGIHTNMKSGMLAAESIFQNSDYEEEFKKSWVWNELHRARNIRPAFRWGFIPGMFNAALDNYILRGCAPWTLKHGKPDHLTLKKKPTFKPIEYPKPDGVLTFDKLSSVYLSNTNHNENQPCHLQLKDPDLAISVNYKEYDSPESYYCPAAVYEIVTSGKEPKFRINFSNCVHCKSCDIKDPMQNINWVPPEGGDGPNY